MLSGIGNSFQLKKIGIEPVHDLPGVGQNLQDHLLCAVQYENTQAGFTLSHAQWTHNPLLMMKVQMDWFLFKRGWGATSHLEAGAFLKSDSSILHPNIQIHAFPGAVRTNGNEDLEVFLGMQMFVGTLRGKSRGSLKLKSKSPYESPIINPNYLNSEIDSRELIEGIHIARKIFSQKALVKVLGEELQPGSNLNSDHDLQGFIAAKAESSYHPCGTCRMGGAADSTVVDSRSMRVVGLQGLRVVDASVMPSETSGNLNAPVLMIAEKAAHLILGQSLH